jgi:ribosomal protein S18 acetylase RimI-like enzyme
MQQDKKLGEFRFCNGELVVFRTPKPQDLEELFLLINSLVDEEAQIAVNKKITRKQESEWLSDLLTDLKGGEVLFVVAETGGHVIGTGQIDIAREDLKHIGIVGIAVKAGFRDIGVGSEIMRVLIGQAVLFKLKVLVLKVLATNNGAIGFYEKFGFSKISVNPKKHLWRGNLVDEVVMTKRLSSVSSSLMI